jgi:HEAT repeat protein
MAATRASATLSTLLSPKAPWGLDHARRAAALVLEDPQQAPALVRALFSTHAELRRHAADAARRVTEKHPALLEPYADRILGALAQSTGDDWRMLAHTGLVAARVAHTRAQRLRAAGLLRPLLHDPSNIVRCTAIEGLGLLASLLPDLRPEVAPILDEALLCGTPGMRTRARAALARLRYI